MTRAFPVQAAWILSLGLLGACSGGTKSPTWAADVQPLLVSGGCTLGPCHGATPMMVAGKTNRLKIVTGMDAANCATVTNAANMLVNKSTPAMSRLVTYPADAGHTGGKLAGWMNASDTSALKVEEWIMGGAACQ